ncbi:hypothetical protein PUN28_003710 [Cardiocondyla obscurior]|uniref:Uncharacterized protein n=1 Tax=Cardiocondyla obscurior TaxID=286306 RepID=A0AAW2GLH3_9HYME
MATIKSIDTHQLTRSPLEVQVLEVELPTLFWVKLKNGEGEINELLQFLTIRMNRIGKNLTLAPDQVEVGTLVAVKEKRRWQRGIVVEVASHTESRSTYATGGGKFTAGNSTAAAWKNALWNNDGRRSRAGHTILSPSSHQDGKKEISPSRKPSLKNSGGKYLFAGPPGGNSLRWTFPSEGKATTRSGAWRTPWNRREQPLRAPGWC